MKDPETSISWMRSMIDRRLRLILPAAQTAPAQLHRAMTYIPLKPGKRYRPLLTVIIAEAFGAEGPDIYDVACTSEMVHAASLILDDLPCMDDARVRRNVPCTHVQFNENTAILAATALLNLSYGVLARAKGLSAQTRINLCDRLSYHVGSNGLIAGQMMDLLNSQSSASVEKVEQLNRLKTGALISYAVESACTLAEIDEVRASALDGFAEQLGLAYQLMDDLKDQLLSPEEAEKDTGKDDNKSTILKLGGLPYARERLTAHVDAAKHSLEKAGLAEHETLNVLVDTQFAVFKNLAAMK